MNSVVAIRREFVPNLVSIYRRRLTESMSIDQAQAALAASRRPVSTVGRDVGLIGVHGIIMRRPGIIDQLFGAVSLQDVMAQFRAHMADPEIGTIVFSIDSPGGETDGLTEASAEIRAGRASKTIVAVADTMACSASYWFASAAGEVVAAPTSVLGNIGVYVIHDDITAMLEQEGVKRDIIASSDLKAAFADGGSLSEEARGQLQAIVDEQAEMFVNDVAKGRGVSTATVRKDFGGGGILGPTASIAAKMIDRVDSLEGAVRKAVSSRAPRVAGELGVPEPVAIINTEPTPEPPKEPERTDLIDIARYRQRAHAR